MKFSKGDALFTGVIFAGIAALAAMLYLHSRERATGSGKTIGKVFFKREVAMRKFSNRMVWEDVENGSPLYAHDAVMTGNLSDAELALDSGLKLRLEANTLVELDLEDSGLNLRLSGGGIKTAGVQTSQTLVTTSNGQVMNVTDGAAAIRTQGNQVAVEVKEGKVEVTGKDGKKETVAKNEILTAGKKSRAVLGVESPAEDSTILAAGDSAKVRIKCTPAETAARAELSHSSDFTGAKTYALNKGEVVAAPGAGDWLMRCLGNDAISPVRRFRIVNAGGYKVYRPEKADIPFDEKPLLRLEFKPPQTVTSTRVEIADNPEFTKPLFSEIRGDNTVRISLPKAGKYYYRLTPAADVSGMESQLPPFTGAVNLVQTTTRAPLAFVALNAPVFSPAQIESGKAIINFEGSGKYTMQIQKRGETKPVVTSEVAAGPVKIPENLPPGKYEIRLASAAEKATLPFEVRDKIKVELLQPQSGTIIYLTPDQKTAALPVTWRGSEEVVLYQLILAEDPGFKNILKKLNVEGSDFRFTGLTARKYFLRVLALENGIPRAESAVHTIAVEEKLPEVTGLYPNPDQKVDVTKSAGLNLKWKPVSGATSYEVKVFQKRKGALVLVDARTTKNNALTVSDFKKLKEGDVIWEVRAQQSDRAGKVIQKSEPVRSHVNLSFGPALPAPEIVPVVEE
ncbi:MAG: FecR domain-containing protein [Turneriella sp.]|nr:FecR domain-containing protein [Turneriella sp.]